MANLPADPETRKAIPLARGLLDYFPAALAEVAHVSQVANDQHNPGEPMHHARGKSTDHADCILRHLVDRGSKDADGLLHSAKVAWRALALLQEELEAAGASMPRGAKAATGRERHEAAPPHECGFLFQVLGEEHEWVCERPEGHLGKCAWPGGGKFEG